jgi:hypothetical protein
MLQLDEIKNLTEACKEALVAITKSKPSEWLPLYTAFGGTIVGAIASFFPTFFLERYREKVQSRRVLASLLAEISAFLEVIEHRKYHYSVKKAIEYLETQPAGTTYSYSVSVPDHYSRIYQENCGNIGAINKKYAQKIVIFHQLIDAVVQDVKPGGIISNGANINDFKEMENIFTRAIKIGNELLALEP